jgi:hypothetical protein
MSNYLNATVPNIKQFITIGILGWVGKHQSDTLVRFMAMVLVFETAYRSVAQIYGFQTIQVSQNHVQYRMLDDQQLCNDSVLDALTSGIPTSQRSLAHKVSRLAVKIRNAIAHGGIASFDTYISDTAGHLVIKAIQGLVAAGIHQMCQVAAYHHWKDVNEERLGSELEDWLAGEKQVLHTVANTADRVTSKSI